jgi:hypothetical protein
MVNGLQRKSIISTASHPTIGLQIYGWPHGRKTSSTTPRRAIVHQGYAASLIARDRDAGGRKYPRLGAPLGISGIFLTEKRRPLLIEHPPKSITARFCRHECVRDAATLRCVLIS